MLVDIVGRNGNLPLNFPLPGNGLLDDRELSVLSALTDWMAVNKEGIRGTRPWKIHGDGPSGVPAMQSQGRLGFNENGRKELKWTGDEVGLKVEMPSEKPRGHAVAFRIAFS
jgi:alpha-L-fucosidase